jgi:hypothetical protein
MAILKRAIRRRRQRRGEIDELAGNAVCRDIIWHYGMAMARNCCRRISTCA